MPQQQRSQRLGLVFDLICREEEAERTALGELQAQVQRAEMQVRELIDYQRQYQNELRSSAHQDAGRRDAPGAGPDNAGLDHIGPVNLSPGKNGPSARLMQNYHVFISRLGVAIEQQEKHIALLGQQVQLQRQKWQLVHQKKNNMADYIARCRQSEQKAEDKQQQRDLDDAVYRRNSFRSDS